MSELVLDCSVAMAWCFEDEASPLADAVLEQLGGGNTTAWVPALWTLEVTNVLLVAERKGRLPLADASRFVELLGGLPIQVVPTLSVLGEALFGLARQTRLSAYDAAYLHLAMHSGLPLATLDGGLQQAAGQVGATLYAGA